MSRIALGVVVDSRGPHQYPADIDPANYYLDNRKIDQVPSMADTRWNSDDYNGSSKGKDRHPQSSVSLRSRSKSDTTATEVETSTNNSNLVDAIHQKNPASLGIYNGDAVGVEIGAGRNPRSRTQEPADLYVTASIVECDAEHGIPDYASDDGSASLHHLLALEEDAAGYSHVDSPSASWGGESSFTRSRRDNVRPTERYHRSYAEGLGPSHFSDRLMYRDDGPRRHNDEQAYHPHSQLDPSLPHHHHYHHHQEPRRHNVPQTREHYDSRRAYYEDDGPLGQGPRNQNRRMDHAIPVDVYEHESSAESVPSFFDDEYQSYESPRRLESDARRQEVARSKPSMKYYHDVNTQSRRSSNYAGQESQWGGEEPLHIPGQDGRFHRSMRETSFDDPRYEGATRDRSVRRNRSYPSNQRSNGTYRGNSDWVDRNSNAPEQRARRSSDGPSQGCRSNQPDCRPYVYAEENTYPRQCSDESYDRISTDDSHDSRNHFMDQKMRAGAPADFEDTRDLKQHCNSRREKELKMPPTQGTPEVYLEVAPGVKEKLRLSHESEKAIETGFYTPAVCWGCCAGLYCVSDATYLICPGCTTISPLEESLPNSHGIGMAFTKETLVEVLRERASRERSRARAMLKYQERAL